MAHDTQTETWDKRKEGIGAAKRRPKRGFKKVSLDKKKKKYTKEQLEMHKSIKEKRHGGKKFKGKVFDASPIQLAKAGMTKSQHYGLPYHSKGFKNTKLTEVKPYGGTIDTGFTGWDKKNKGKGFKKGGRAGFQHGGRTNLLEELGRVEAEPSNRNRRAEVSRIHGELNRGYKDGGSPHTKDKQRPPRKKFITGYSSKGKSRTPVREKLNPYASGGAVLKGKKVGIQIK